MKRPRPMPPTPETDPEAIDWFATTETEKEKTR